MSASGDALTLVLIGYGALLGAGLAVCYGALTFVRIVLTPIGGKSVARDVLIFVFDIIFSVFAALCVVLLFFGANNGSVRLIGLASVGAGFSLYHFTVGRAVTAYLTRFVSAVRRGLAFVYRRTFGALFRLAARLAARPVRSLKRRAAARAQAKKARARARRGGQYKV